MTRVLILAGSLLMLLQVAEGQFINSRDLQQDSEKLKVCMTRAKVTKVGEFEINPKYIERVHQYNPDATFVISNDGLTECGMNGGTCKYSPLATDLLPEISTSRSWSFSRNNLSAREWSDEEEPVYGRADHRDVEAA